MITHVDKIGYVRLMGDEVVLEMLQGWSEDDFYAVYLNFNYKGLPSVVLNATFRVITANLNLNGHGFTESEEKLFSYGYGRASETLHIKVTSHVNMIDQGKRYFMAFAKETLSRQVKDNFALYDKKLYRDGGNMLTKTQSESTRVIDYISDKDGYSKTGLKFDSSDKSDIIGYIAGELLTFPNQKRSIAQEYITIWGMAIREYIQIPRRV